MNEHTQIDETGFFDILFKRWKLIVACALCMGVVGILYAKLLAQPVYRSTVTTAPRGDENASSLGALQGALGGLGGLANIRFDSSSKKDEYIAYLTSNKFLSSFAGFVGARDELYEEPDETVTRNDVVDKLRRNIVRVQLDKTTGLLRVSVELPSPDMAAEWANMMVEMANEQIRVEDLADAESSLTFLNEELARTSIVSVQEAIAALVEVQVNRKMLANVRKEFAFRVLDPALASDEDDPVKPNVGGLTIIGLMAGFLLGALGVLLFSNRATE